MKTSVWVGFDSVEALPEELRLLGRGPLVEHALDPAAAIPTADSWPHVDVLGQRRRRVELDRVHPLGQGSHGGIEHSAGVVVGFEVAVDIAVPGDVEAGQVDFGGIAQSGPGG